MKKMITVLAATIASWALVGVQVLPPALDENCKWEYIGSVTVGRIGARQASGTLSLPEGTAHYQFRVNTSQAFAQGEVLGCVALQVWTPETDAGGTTTDYRIFHRATSAFEYIDYYYPNLPSRNRQLIIVGSGLSTTRAFICKAHKPTGLGWNNEREPHAARW